jgi:hypothetical protein
MWKIRGLTLGNRLGVKWIVPEAFSAWLTDSSDARIFKFPGGDPVTAKSGWYLGNLFEVQDRVVQVLIEVIEPNARRDRVRRNRLHWTPTNTTPPDASS